MVEINKDIRGRTSANEPVGVIAQIHTAIVQGLDAANKPLAQSLQVSVESTAAVSQALHETVRELRRQNDLQARMMYSPTAFGGGLGTPALTRQDLVDGVSQALVETAASFLQTFQQVSGEGFSGPAIPARSSVVAPGGPVGPGTPRVGRMAPPGTPEAPNDQWGFTGGFEQGRNYLMEGGRFNLGNLQQDFSRSLGERLSRSNFGAQEAVRNLRLPTFSGGSVDLGPAMRGVNGTLMPVADDVAEAAIRQQGIRQVGMNALRAGAAGEGVGGMVGALGGGAAKLAGGVGLAYTVAQQGIAFAEDQRSQNLEYQRALGGSNAEGFGQRAREQMFGWSQIGGMGSGQAQELFRSVTALGMQGNERGRAIEEAGDWFYKFGMNVSESVELIKSASENGITAFSELTTALDQVTEAARNSGVSAVNARQMFTQNFQRAAATIGGQAAVGFAGAVTSEFVGQGPAFQNVDASGMFTDQNLAVLGAMNGMSQPEVLALARSNSSNDRARLAQMQQRFLTQNAQVLLGRQGMAAIDQFVQANPQANDTQFRQLATELMRGPLRNVDTRAIQELLGAVGIEGVTSQNAVEMLARVQTGKLNVATAQENYEKGVATSTLGQGDNKDIYDVIARVRGEDVKDVRLDAQVGSNDEIGGTGLFMGQTKRAENLYLRNVEKTKRVSPLIEQALKNFDPNWRFKVQVADGKEREVTMDDALRYFGDQLAKGDVQITEGRSAGSTLAEAVGLEGDRNVNITSASNQKLAGKGKAADGVDFGEGVQGRVLVSAAPELRRLLRFSGEGIATTDPNVPPNPHPRPGQL